MPHQQKLENLFKSNPLLSPKVDIYLPNHPTTGPLDFNSSSSRNPGGLPGLKSSSDAPPAELHETQDDNNKPVARGYSYLATHTPTLGTGAHASRTPRFSNTKYGSNAAGSDSSADKVAAQQLVPTLGEMDGLPGIQMKKNSKFLSTYSRNFAGSEKQNETWWSSK